MVYSSDGKDLRFFPVHLSAGFPTSGYIQNHARIDVADEARRRSRRQSRWEMGRLPGR